MTDKQPQGPYYPNPYQPACTDQQGYQYPPQNQPGTYPPPGPNYSFAPYTQGPPGSMPPYTPQGMGPPGYPSNQGFSTWQAPYPGQQGFGNPQQYMNQQYTAWQQPPSGAPWIQGQQAGQYNQQGYQPPQQVHLVFSQPYPMAGPGGSSQPYPYGFPPSQTGYPAPGSYGQQFNNNKKGKKQYFVPVGPNMPSLRPDLSTSPMVDSNILSAAFKGLGCDQPAVIRIITGRTANQLEQIKLAFGNKHSRSLIERCKSELYDPLERLVICRLHTGFQMYAYLGRKTTKGIGTDDDALIYVVCTLSGFEMNKMKEQYLAMYGKSFESHVRSDTSGSYRDLLITLINNPRDETQTTDNDLAMKQASELYSTRSVIKISAPSRLIHLFSRTNFAQFRLIQQHFFKLFGRTLYSFLKSYIGTNYEKALMTICSYVTHPLHFHSKYLRDAILKRNIMHVIMIVCSRCEIDLETIQQDYLAMYRVSPHSELITCFQSQHPNTVRAILNLMGR